MPNNKLSATKLSQRLNIPIKHLVGKMYDDGLLENIDGEKRITNRGKKAGAEYVESKKFGRYVVWPEDVVLKGVSRENLVSVTDIGGKFDLPARRINKLFSELGWIKNYLKGWIVTPLGIKAGGLQRENNTSGISYVIWNKSILEHPTLLGTIREMVIHTNGGPVKKQHQQQDQTTQFRKNNLPGLRTIDGHFVRSRAEMLIDNWLYMSEISHAYERRVPVEEELICDFYLPSGNVYIEFWGMENSEKYQQRKKKKIELYRKYSINLIELRDTDIANLDDVLPKQLLNYDIKIY